MNVDNTQDIRILSLCSGYGGLELGLRRVLGARMRTVAYVEVEAFAVANLVSKMETGKLDAVPVWTDIKTFDGRPFCGRVHGIIGGYPCQPFSVAGKRQGTADPRHLWPFIAGIIKAVRPIWCFFENVPGHLSIGFTEVYRGLRDMDYSVEAGLFTAAECGAPHRRQRLFILAYSQSRGLWGPEQECDNQADTRGRRCNAIQLNQSQLSQLGNTEGTGQQGGIYGQGQEQFGRTSTRWPARPGQEQYEWEEPRVVLHAKSKRLEGICKTGEGGKKSYESIEGQAQSRLGGAVDGTACRVDRLRLLGNGVVPQQAEKAFRELWGYVPMGLTAS